MRPRHQDDLVLGVAAVVGAVAVGHVARSYREGIQITIHRVPWPGERRVRVVQLSDVHAGPSTPQWMLARVAAVAGTLAPDVVVLTGDYVNASTFYARRVTELVRALPKPCVATLGNHDHFAGAERIAFALRRGGAKVLQNEAVTIVGLTLVGVDDGRSGHADVARAFAGVDATRALVLSHFPNTADEIAKTGAPLVLSGHTHAGHVEVPWVTRTVARVTGNPYLAGFYRCAPQTDLYVNAGLGHSFPGLRAGRGTRPEITVFDLDPAAEERTSEERRAAWRQRRQTGGRLSKRGRSSAYE
jgi:predicted MPP superfamily phosphohydrolase